MGDTISTIPVSVIILTWNEEINITECVESLQGFSEVIVVDSGSTDGTCQIIVERFPQVRVFTNPFEDFGQQRNWAIDYTEPKEDWILFIDADEFMEPPLAEEIRKFVSDPGGVVGGYIAGRNYFLGKWLKRCTFFPSYQLRLLKCGEVSYEKAGHGQKELTAGSLIYLKESWRHEAFSKGVANWIARHNSYSSEEIQLIMQLREESVAVRDVFTSDPIVRRRVLKRVAAKVPFRAVLNFFYGYFWKFGFLDGRRGLQYCLLRFTHEVHIGVKMSERRFLEEARSKAEGSRMG